MAFCKFCGKEIPDGTTCDCEGSKSNSPEVNSTPAYSNDDIAPATKSSNKSTLVLACGLIIVLLLIIAFISTIAGGGYKKPVNKFIKALNKSDGEMLIEAMFSDDITDDIDEDELEGLEDGLNWMVELCEEEYGKKLKFSYDIDDKEKLSKKEIKEIEETYQDDYDIDVDISKAYELDGEMTIKGKDKKDSEDATIVVVKIKGDGWRMFPDSMF